MTQDVTHPEKLARFHCEQCGAVTHVDNGVTRKDSHGDEWEVCQSCGGDFDVVYVEAINSGPYHKVKKANHHEIETFPNGYEAEVFAREIAFRVEQV